MFAAEFQVKQFIAEVNGRWGSRWRVYATGSDRHYLLELVGQIPPLQVPVLKSDLQPQVRRALAHGAGHAPAPRQEGHPMPITDDEPLVTGSDPHQAALCGMPDCNQPLVITFTASAPVLLADTTLTLAAGENETGHDWRVECVAGHVVLLPLEDGRESHIFGECACNDAPATTACGRTDLARLRRVIAKP